MCIFIIFFINQISLVFRLFLWCLIIKTELTIIFIMKLRGKIWPTFNEKIPNKTLFVVDHMIGGQSSKSVTILVSLMFKRLVWKFSKKRACFREEKHVRFFSYRDQYINDCMYSHVKYKINLHFIMCERSWISFFKTLHSKFYYLFTRYTIFTTDHKVER